MQNVGEIVGECMYIVTPNFSLDLFLIIFMYVYMCLYVIIYPYVYFG